MTHTVPAFKFIMRDRSLSMLSYYGICVLVQVFLFALVIGLDNGRVTYSLEMSGLIFALITGLVSFREYLRYLLQNGVSRRSFFAAALLSALATAALMTAADRVLFGAFGLIGSGLPDFRLTPLFEQLPGSGALYATLLSFCAYAALCSAGFFITLVFYRLGKLGKILVGAGVPVFLLMVLPVADSVLLEGALSQAIARAAIYFLGAPLRLCTLLLAFVVISQVLSWPLMRRAEIK